MAASPNSAAATSDIEPLSSPVQNEGKSFISRAADDDDDTRMADATPDPVEKPARGKGKGSQTKDGSGQQIGKIRHLKKEDGEPLWRSDIQYDFLKAVFDDEEIVFTNSYDTTMAKQNFADLYIDTMARSSKTSKVLRDKLLNDREAAKGMAMVCLLVNMGRMNTTLNCKTLSKMTWPWEIVNSPSLSRNASAAADISRNSISPSQPGSSCVQATSRCASSEIYPERRR